MQELLNVLDNFERAGTAITTETDREASIQQSYQVFKSFRDQGFEFSVQSSGYRVKGP